MGGDPVHSKLETDEWPDTEAVLAAIAARIAPR